MSGTTVRYNISWDCTCGPHPNRHSVTRMLRLHELRENPVSVTARDGDGAAYTVVATRLREGVVKMTCRCPRYLRAGWCNHCLAVFSDRRVFEDNKHREEFERLVGATYLEEAAAKLIKALDIFTVAYSQMMRFGDPSNVDRSQLIRFTGQADQAGRSAYDLAVALEEFINQAAGNPPYDESEPSAASSSFSNIKERAIGMLRRALTKREE
jgi:hypothetical protein